MHSPSILHSFPTRRSSDLLVAYLHAARIAMPTADDRIRCARSVYAVDVQQLLQAAPDHVLRRAGQIRLVTQGVQDRKSTRLNSSHVAISYAVFCLKKKKHV